MMARWRFLGAALAVAVVAGGLMAGCSQRDGRQRVTGIVTLDGQPLASGAINFRPLAGLEANSAGAPIANGRFDLPAASGLKPGDYAVTIVAMKATGRMVNDEQMGQVPEMVPIRFREEGQLKATVVAGQKAHFEFQLTTAP